MKIGIRVLVPFGRSRTHVGIVVKTHKGPLPSDFQIKDILQVLDAEPILLDTQLCVVSNPNISPLYTEQGNYIFTENVWWAGGSR